jgi:hypothetical protein
LGQKAMERGREKSFHINKIPTHSRLVSQSTDF